VKPKVYLETSFIGYLTAWPARDIVVLAHQQLTREWWETRRSAFELFTSEIVTAEAERGDAAAVRARQEVVAATQRLSASPAAEALVPKLLKATGLPAKVFADMAHVALATVHGMQYLLTWNCRHIANATILRTVAKTCRDLGYEPPVICTPEELMSGE
jgi:predicted nucleic acid-binding protein